MECYYKIVTFSSLAADKLNVVALVNFAFSACGMDIL